MPHTELDDACIDTIRFLSADAVQAASSGHPGLPMGAAPMGYALWTDHLRHNPTNPSWANRDRFVLSGGHGSMLLYSLLHLTGYDLPLDELRNFRQLGSRTPGHPEHGMTPGVEATTGPLGQGISTAVGMAVAEAHLAAVFNRPGHEIVDHRTWVLASDGDLMEGVAAEACSLAGHLRLGKLNVLYDANHICLAGSTALSFTEDTAARLEAMGWHTQTVEDGNDLAALDAAMTIAEETDRPSLLVVHTTIGFGAPNKQGTFGAHGAPLGEDELRLAKEGLGWPTEPSFLVPDEVRNRFRATVERGDALEGEWRARFGEYSKTYPDEAAEFERRVLLGELVEDWASVVPVFPADPKGMPTRKAGKAILQALGEKLPELVGGSADLNPSTFTFVEGGGDFQDPRRPTDGIQGHVGGPWGREGRNVHYGVREHAMGAITNGMALHGGIVPYASTFLTFSDYMRPAIRISALSGIAPIWVFTHDSIGLGEDGPTHQPIEHVAALRAIPRLLTFRPADANETAEAWKLALEHRDRPSALILTRQNVPTLDRETHAPAAGLRLGAYVLNPEVADPELILLASGSEVALAIEASHELRREGVATRVVSMPCWELFAEQSVEERERVLPRSVRRRLAIEAAVRLGWDRWVGEDGDVLSIDRFGESAPGGTLFREFGYTVENVVARARRLLGDA